jgi:hypothetical protein
MKQAVAGQQATRGPSLARWAGVAAVVLRKVTNAASYKVTSSLHRLSVRLRVALLKSVLQRNAPWPSRVPPLSVLEIYEVLESQYQPPALSNVPVLLVRASAGDGDDTPYRERYAGADFGWSRVAGRLELVDVQGGHASMLQEHAIDSLASALNKRLGFLKLKATPEVSMAE